ncbi:unnamed protein product [Orchesella dallaii]|uniref:Ion transport domain-containing protein n=1 Tax=Orchesella dallaii TaxID=48710 RepID=A0ABP1PSW8_9HEXA
MGQNQVKTEKEATESIPILMDDVNQKQQPVEPLFPLHRAAYFGNLEKVKELLTTVIPGSSEPLTRRPDNAKLTPLHHAVLGANPRSEEICTLLILTDQADPLCVGKDALVDLTDAKGKTAMHYAAACKQPHLITMLLNYGANPNVKDLDEAAPLHICAEGNSEAAIDCVRVLLSSPNIIPYEPCGQNRNVMHIAANAMASKMLGFLLHKGFDHSRKDSRGYTPLMLTASAGDSDEALKCIETLMNVASAEEINAKADDNHQTAIMMAAYRSHQKVLKALLANSKTDICLIDSHRRTALHWAVEAWFRTNSLACVKLLAESEQVCQWDQKQLYLYGMKDSKGESPIDIAIKHHSIRITEYLITAHPSPEAWLQDDMMEKIYSTLPEAMVPLMNQSLRYNPAKFHERNEAIEVEFGTVTGFSDPVMDEPKPETKFLHHIMYAPKEIQRTVFLHPLVQIFIDLKWKNIRWLTWIAIMFQFTWIILYTVMVFEIFIPNCSEGESSNATSSSAEVGDGTSPKKKTLKILLSLGFVHREDSNLEDCDFNHEAAQVCAIALYFLSIILLVKEAFQMRHFTNYFFDVTNYAQLLIVLIAFINSAPAWQSSSEVDKWQTYLAAFGCFVAWVLSLREVGKFPRCGIYAAILKKVFWHCLKMLIFYFPLLVAFTLCLRILIPGKGQYTYLFFAIVKVVIMMTGELDFEDAFYGDDGPSLALNAIFGQFVFLLLVFITTIVLLNLLTGLAVNDVQSLIEEAEINRLCNELEQIYLLESLIQLTREKVLGLERWSNLFYSLNVTTSKFTDYCSFTSVQNVETKSYPQDLKGRIKKNMIPVEDNN